jgi:spermidine synthase
VLADGRNFLLSNPDAFDVITLEPPPPNDAGTVNLYTREFYRLCKARLRPDGVMAQWLPLYLYDDDLRMLVRAFLAEFPHVTLWTTERQETLLVGTAAPLSIDVGRLAARMAEPAVAADLDAIGIRSPAELLSLYLMDEDGLRAFVGEGPALTDDFPRPEYSIPSDLFRDYPRTLAYLLAHRAPIAPHLRNVADADALAADIARHASILDDFYRSGLAFQAGDRRKSAELGMSVYARDPVNAYFLSYLPADQEAQLRARAVTAPSR